MSDVTSTDAKTCFEIERLFIIEPPAALRDFMNRRLYIILP